MEFPDFDPVEDEREDLCHCGNCSSNLVRPVEWEALEDGRYRMLAHCPECDWWAVGVHEEDKIEAYDQQYREDVSDMDDLFRERKRENMEEYVEAAISALRAGHILPEDF